MNEAPYAPTGVAGYLLSLLLRETTRASAAPLPDILHPELAVFV